MKFDITATAVAAARAYDNGDIRQVRNLYQSLVSRGAPTEQVSRVFAEQGASLELLPTGDKCLGMLSATKD